MPPNYALTSLGPGEGFRPAGGCPAASQWSPHGEYMPHQGDAGSFLVADARTGDGTAAIRLALWRCVYCRMLLTGIARADGDPDAAQQFTWFEEEIALISESPPACTAHGPAVRAGGSREEAP